RTQSEITIKDFPNPIAISDSEFNDMQHVLVDRRLATEDSAPSRGMEERRIRSIGTGTGIGEEIFCNSFWFLKSRAE
ncbi:hypothetical protein, partial [Klebsiella aerogenes]|uniref:hypothetical protein n=1 Tax=Klebsiella aerogenes TaxID=548 RepID=UPI001CC39FEA